MHECRAQKAEHDSTDRWLAAASLLSLPIEPPRIEDKSNYYVYCNNLITIAI